MIQIKLRENLRYYDDFDTDFNIRAGEVKELPLRLLKSYSFKRALMNGDLILVEGSIEFKFKDALFKVSSENPNDGIFLFSDNTTQVKDLLTNTMKPKVDETVKLKTGDLPILKVEVKPVVKSGSLSTVKLKEELIKNGKSIK